MPGDVDTASSCAIAARVTQAQATVQAALAAISAERRGKAAEEKQTPLSGSKKGGSIHRATTAAKSLSAHSSLTSPLVADASATGTIREDVERCVRGEWELFEAETSLRLQLGRCAEQVLNGFTARPPLPTQLIEQVRLRAAEQGELRARVERLGLARVEEQRRLCSAEAGRLEQHERRVSELSQQLSRARADRDVVSAEVGRLQREEARRERAEEALRQQQAELARSEAELRGLGARAHELAARQAHVARARLRAAVAAAEERSRRELAALSLHCGDSGAATEALCALAATSPSSREDPSAVPEEQGRAAVRRSCVCIGSPRLSTAR